MEATQILDGQQIKSGDIGTGKNLVTITDYQVEEFHQVQEEDDVVAHKTSNSYAAKKTVAQGMMDIALITSNANQLRYMVEYGSESKTYYLNLVLITISLCLQVAVGVSLLFKGKYQLKGDLKHKNVSLINNFSVIGVFLVTLINVFIASFTMSEKTPAPSVGI